MSFLASFLFIFVFSTKLFNTVDASKKIVPITGLKPRIPSVGSDRSTNCATTTALSNVCLVTTLKGPLWQEDRQVLALHFHSNILLFGFNVQKEPNNRESFIHKLFVLTQATFSSGYIKI